jgi:TonB family protein
VGDAPKPPPIAAPAPAVVAPRPAPEPPKPEPKPDIKPEPQQNRIPDRAEALIVSAPPPAIPAAVTDEGVSGSVTVGFTVEANGRISNVRVIRSDDRRLDDAAKAAARRIKAKAAVQGGIARDTQASYTYRFVAQ